MAAVSTWKILQLTPSAGWVARFRSAAGESEENLAAWALVDDGGRTQVVGMVATANSPACTFAPSDERFAGYFYRGAQVPVAADLPQVAKTVKAGVAWKSATRTE